MLPTRHAVGDQVEIFGNNISVMEIADVPGTIPLRGAHFGVVACQEGLLS